MTVHTLHGMYVIGAIPASIGSIHLHHIYTTAGYGRMTGFTCIGRIVGMTLVTSSATNSFMHTGGSFIIFSTRFMSPVGCMALHTETLYRVIGNQDLHSIQVYIWFAKKP